MLTAPPPVHAAMEAVTVHDAQGRPFGFDAGTTGADPAPFVAALSRAVHGEEIRDLTVRVVPARAIRASCSDARAVACYARDEAGRGVITTSPGLGRQGVRNLLHEYGHHIDATYGNGALQDPNGTPRWWAARRMGALLASGRAARTYARGWERAVGEVFAEDYMVMNLGGRSGIAWLPQPSRRVRAAMRRDIVGYRGPVPDWPAGDITWRAFAAGVVGQGQVVTVEVPAPSRGQRIVVSVRPDAPRAITPLTAVVACPGTAPFVSAAPRGQGLTVTVGAPVGATCTAEVRGDDATSGGASLQVVVAPASQR